MGSMRVLGWAGDTETRWSNAREAKQAKAEFDYRLKKEGMIAFLVDPQTGQGAELIREFDPNAEEIILSRQLRGG